MEGFGQLICLYAVIKEIMNRLGITKYNSDIAAILSLLITIVISPVIFIILSLFGLYKAAIVLVLKLKWKEQFIRTTDAIETLYCSCTNCVPSVFLFIEYSKSADDLKAEIVELVNRLLRHKEQKLFYFRDSFMGYHYFYKDEVKADDFVTVMQNVELEGSLTQKQYMEKYMDYEIAPLPHNDKSVFEIVFCPQKVVLDKYPEKQNLYALAYRVHHAVADGGHLINYFTKVISDYKEEENCESTIPNNYYNREPSKNKWNIMRKFLSEVKIKDIPCSVSDRNTLRGYKLEEKKHFVWYTEDDAKYINKIKAIKNSMKGVTFLDVINTCLATSLQKYFKKNAVDNPKEIIGGLVLALDPKMYMNDINDVKLTNKFSCSTLHLPINLGNDVNNNNLLNRLKLLNAEYNEIKHSFDIKFNYELANMCNVFPYKLMLFAASLVEITIGISSFVGCKKFSILGGKTVEEFLPMPPNSPGTGLHLVVSAYGGGLRISLSVDRSVIKHCEDAQEIIDNMILCIDDLTSMVLN